MRCWQLVGPRHHRVVMLRSSDHLTPDEQARLIAAVLARVRADLEQSASASVTPERVRLRNLPIAPT